MKRMSQRWPLLLVSLLAAGVIGARMRWPALLFDTNSLILFGIACGALILAFIPLRKFKWGDFEAELDTAVAGLERKVAASQAMQPTTPRKLPPRPAPTAAQELNRELFDAFGAGGDSWTRYFDEYSRLVQSETSNVEKIVGAAILIERMLDSAAQALELGDQHRRGNPRKLVEVLAKEGFLTREELEAFSEFWSIRNRVLHEGIGLSDEQTARILDSLWRLVRALA